MKLSELKAKQNILIYGYGVEGKSTKAFLEKHDITCDIHDDKIIAHRLSKNIDNYDVIIVSAGIKRDMFPVEQQKKCTSNTELFFHNISESQRQKIIGVTGTKGKSMTAKLTHETIEHSGKKSLLAGNIGVAPLDIIDTLDAYDWIVLELSSYQLNSLDVSPHIALCTNLFEDHIDWHGTTQKYHAAKENLWKHQQEQDLLLVPAAHEHQFKTDRKIICPEVLLENTPNSSIWQAPHYRQNFGLVQSLCENIGIPHRTFVSALAHLEPLPHRLQTIGTFQDIIFIDNAISTNQHSTMADLVFFGAKLGSLILGGEDRGQDFGPLFEYIVQNNLPTHIIVPDSNTSKRIIDQIKSDFTTIPVHPAKNMEEAVALGYKHTLKNHICLLSPSAASWDRYKNYQAKGDAFKRCVLSHSN